MSSRYTNVSLQQDHHFLRSRFRFTGHIRLWGARPMFSRFLGSTGTMTHIDSRGNQFASALQLWVIVCVNLTRACIDLSLVCRANEWHHGGGALIPAHCNQEAGRAKVQPHYQLCFSLVFGSNAVGRVCHSIELADSQLRHTELA